MKTLLPALSACALLAGACVDNDQSMVITRFVPLQSTNMCEADPSAQFIISMGVLDTSVVATGARLDQAEFGYIAAPVVENELLDESMLGGTTSIQRNNIQITGFDVELQPPPGDAAIPTSLPTQFFVSASGGIIMPAGGLAAVPVEVIPSAIASDLDARKFQGTVIVHMRPEGTHDSGNLAGGWVDFPVQVCHECLTVPDQPCPSTGYTASQVQMTGCYPEQDYPSTCCIGTEPNSQERLLCGSSVPLSM